MSLPSLANWETTARGLHMAAQILGVIRKVSLPHVPNYLEMGLKIKSEGLSTDILPGGTEIVLNFAEASLVIYSTGTNVASIAIAGQDQPTLLRVLLSALKQDELADILKGAAQDELTERFLAAASAAGYNLASAESQIAGRERLDINQQLSRDYGQALYQIFTGVARFRAHLNGPQTPVVVWPGHFDLSFLWFATERAEESAPHLNFGFAPFGGGIDVPYLYAYAYPMPPPPANGDVALALPALPAPAYWHTQGWKGVVVRYAAMAAADDPEEYVEQMCEGIFRALRPLLG